ncbi:hypothetical protein [Roseobacter sp. A03A-229]
MPGRISINGIGDFKGSKEMERGLTTVRLPARRIGHLAGQQLAQSIVGDRTEVRREDCEIALFVWGTRSPVL